MPSLSKIADEAHPDIVADNFWSNDMHKTFFAASLLHAIHVSNSVLQKKKLNKRREVCTCMMKG